jgi:hypothetical protein
VAVSINIDRVLSYPWLPGRAGETAVLLVGVLVESLVLLAPGQSRIAVGLELLVVAGSLWMLITLIHVRLRRYRSELATNERWARILSGQAASVPPVIAGLSLLAEAGGGLYWLFAGITLSLVAAVFNAWILLIEIMR